MEMYGCNPGREEFEPEPQPQWPETGLEESMWRLGLTGRETYPERSGVSDCVYYMRTGFCGFGNRCRYNHPRDRASAAMATRLAGEDYPERPGELPCQYYLKTKTCKFGASCKFHHPRNSDELTSNVKLNSRGCPLRPGERFCSYYLKTGHCKFGTSCRFHHPEIAGVVPFLTAASSFYSAVQSPSLPVPEPIGGVSPNFGMPRPPLLPGSYVSGAYGPMMLSPGVVPVPGWTSYSAPLSPALSPNVQPSGAGPLYGVAPLSASTPTVVGAYSPVQSPAHLSITDRYNVKFPERPGEPECIYYLRTGDCKYGSVCRYHHPPERAASMISGTLSPLGLPIRPGEQTCAFYMRNGFCKYGPICKFNHPMASGSPMNYIPSSSSLTEMPVAPYIAESSSLPSLPTSLSPDLSPENRLGLYTDSQPGAVSSSQVNLDVSGLTMSETTPVSHSDAQG